MVAGSGRGVGQSLAEQVGGVDFHAGRDLVAEKGHEDEVQLLLVGDPVEAGVTEADGFSLGVGGDGDDGGQIEGEAEALVAEGFADFGVDHHLDGDASVSEDDLGLFGIGVAGRLLVAFDVVASVLTAEELLAEGAVNGATADAELDGAGRKEPGEREKQPKQESPIEGEHKTMVTPEGGRGPVFLTGKGDVFGAVVAGMDRNIQ
jgi:hypothetical protein